MTSAINTTTINTAYPVAGADNDTQGFRDNFTNIVGGLSTAASEISVLQSNAVLKANLTTNGTVANNLAGSSIYNGTFSQFYGSAYINTISASTFNIDLTSGPVQFLTMTTDVAYTFTNWPASGQMGVVRVILASDGTSQRTATFASANGGTIKYGNGGLTTNGFSSPFTTPRTVTRTTVGTAAAAQAVLTFNDIMDIIPGNTVSGGSAIQAGTTVQSVNINNNTVALSNVLLSQISGSTSITFSYTGPRVIEAFTVNGGSTVYLYQIADF
jgi:hypothetical protein